MQMEEIGGDFNRLPEACVSHVLSLTTPRDSCRLAAVSPVFRSAVDSDTLWERFLPSDYKEILDRAVEKITWSSKRDLYFRLCDPILIDGGKMSFQLEKSSGAMCHMISSRELAIVWGGTSHYWRWMDAADLSVNARFPEVAYLLSVCWLEIHGKIQTRTLTPNTNYAGYLVYKLDPSSHGFSAPVQQASVKVGNHESKHNVCLNPDPTEQPWGTPGMFRRFLRGRVGFVPNQALEELRDSRVPGARADGWMEVEMGEFFSGDGGGGDDEEVDLCLMEVRGGHWKRGLIVLGIEVRPKK